MSNKNESNCYATRHQKLRVAIVGATGVVGKEVIKILENQQFPVDSLKLLASENSKGQLEVFQGDPVEIDVLEPSSFDDVDIAIFSAGGAISKDFCPIAIEKGVLCIDNTSQFRMDASVPLIVPEVNGHLLNQKHRLIANPNCSTAQAVLALSPLQKAFGLETVVYATYQSVSGAGKAAIEDLEQESRHNLSGREYKTKSFAYEMAFNVLPQIDVFMDNGYTKEEMKMIDETKKILDIPEAKITATAVRVPVFVGHGVDVHINLKKPFDIERVIELFQETEGVEVLDDVAENRYPTPRDAAGKDPVFVGRIRRDLAFEHGLSFWCVADNLRKGAALNAVQIAEACYQKGFFNT